MEIGLVIKSSGSNGMSKLRCYKALRLTCHIVISLLGRLFITPVSPPGFISGDFALRQAHLCRMRLEADLANPHKIHCPLRYATAQW